MNSRKIIFLVVTALCMAASAFAQGSTGTTTTTLQYSFPPTGLALTETAQIDVSNLAANASNGTAASCTGSVSFVNSSGATIGTATTFTVTSGQIASISLPFAKASVSGSRTVIRGIVQHTVTRPATAPCSLVFSLEVFDTSTGVTHLLLGNSQAGSERP